jgi:hypothetical protein
MIQICKRPPVGSSRCSVVQSGFGEIQRSDFCTLPRPSQQEVTPIDLRLQVARAMKAVLLGAAPLVVAANPRRRGVAASKRALDGAASLGVASLGETGNQSVSSTGLQRQALVVGKMRLGDSLARGCAG